MCYLYLFSRLDLRLAFRYSLLKGDIIDFPYFFINLNSSAYEIFQCQRSMFAQKFVTANCDNENFIIETCTSLIYMFASFMINSIMCMMSVVIVCIEHDAVDRNGKLKLNPNCKLFSLSICKENPRRRFRQ